MPMCCLATIIYFEANDTICTGDVAKIESKNFQPFK